MPIPLTNLDDRTFADLMEETRALIPRYAPIWTDHNASDPGMMLIELFAWLTEALIYRLNRIPEASEARFLELLGAMFRPAQPSAAKLMVTATGLEETLIMPRGTPLMASPAGESKTLGFETVHDLQLTPETPSGSVEVRQTIRVEGERLGISNGQPHQVFSLARPFLVLGLEGPSRIVPEVEVTNVAWSYKPSLLGSTGKDSHFTCEPRTNAIRFGDDRLGQIPPQGATIVANYYYTLGTQGNVPAGTRFKIDIDSNLPGSSIRQALDTSVSFAMLSENDASGGTAPTRLDEAREQAIDALKERFRAITTEDFEDIVLGQIDFNLARAKCLAELDLTTSEPSTLSPGHVSIIIVPHPDSTEAKGKPVPSPKLVEDVWTFLDQRRLVTCRHHVVGPIYTDVCIQAEVVRDAQVEEKALQKKIKDNLQAFFHPLSGGPEPEKKGWPFGRDVYISEVYQVIEATEGVNHVESATLYSRENGRDWTEAGNQIDVARDSLVYFDPESSDITVRAER